MKTEKEKKYLKVLEKLKKSNVPLFGNNRSFACNSTRRKWKINKQSSKIIIKGKKIVLSPKLIRTIKKQSLKN